jgi:O-methyltransferase
MKYNKIKTIVSRILKIPKSNSIIDELSFDISDFTSSEIRIFQEVQPFTMTSSARIKAIFDSVNFLEKNKINGDIVECGVWRGGSSMAIANSLKEIGNFDRNLWLFDTFDGMTKPTDFDIDLSGKKAQNLLDKESKDTSLVWASAQIEEVKRNMRKTYYPEEKLHYIIGPVEETLRNIKLPLQISLLRLDTDWYESTKVELEVLFPLLVSGGILIIDDYGHWGGCRKAVDEYFEKIEKKYFLHRIDYTGRLIIK